MAPKTTSKNVVSTEGGSEPGPTTLGAMSGRSDAATSDNATQTRTGSDRPEKQQSNKKQRTTICNVCHVEVVGNILNHLKQVHPRNPDECGKDKQKNTQSSSKGSGKNRGAQAANKLNAQLSDMNAQMKGAEDALKEIKTEQKETTNATVEDVMHPYVVGPMGEDLTTNWTISEYTKENVIADTVLGTQLDGLSDILICDLDFREIALFNVCAHTMRLAEVALMWSSFAVEGAIRRGQSPPHQSSDYILQEMSQRKDKSLTEFMGATHASFLQLRASIEPYETDVLQASDVRPSFDRSEKRLIEQLYILKPYILQRVEPGENRNPTIIDDPLAFAMYGWEHEASAWQKLMSLKVPFKPKIISAQMLAELVNRRTILAGVDNPKACWSRMTDIVERSPYFQEDFTARLTQGISVAKDTRDVAFAMVTGRPWLVRNQAF